MKHKIFLITMTMLATSALCFSQDIRTTEKTIGKDSVVIVKHNVMMPTNDGVRLATDVYHLKDATPRPTLVARTPYDKERFSKGNRPTDLERFIKAGYNIVIQDVRGRYASEGTFIPHANETSDGLNCFEWITQQDWSNGTIGTFGGSYVGGTQWLPARENPAALKTMIPEVTFSDMYEGNTHPGGVKVLHDLRWTVASILPDVIKRKEKAGEAVPNENELPDVSTVLEVLPVASHPMIQKYTPFYKEWLNHPTAGTYWDSISPNAGYSNITASAMNISGWYDIFIWGTLQNYRGMKDNGTGNGRHQKLIIGPWAHGNFSGKFPERDFGEQASSEAIDLDGIKLRWYNRWLKGEQNGIDTEDPVMIFVMGINQWRTEKDWPIPDTKYTEYFLHSSGTANTAEGNGSLSLVKPQDESSDIYVYDPMNPVPTIGGQVILPGENTWGPRDQQEIEQRKDVLVYTTPTLTDSVEVTGNITLRLFISSDAPDTDFAAKLVDVFPDGRAIILTNGILRTAYRNSFKQAEPMKKGEVYELNINMLATSNVFLPGHKIRLEVSSSNFPQFARNSNTGRSIAEESAEQYRKATNVIYHSAEHPSRLILPIIER